MAVSESVLAWLLTSAYVGVLYMSPGDRPDGTFVRNRNNPQIIRRRMAKVITVGVLDVVAVVAWLRCKGTSTSVLDALVFMGLVPGSKGSWLAVGRDVAANLAMFLVLFVGPLADGFLVQGDNLPRQFVAQVQTLEGFRDLVVAPFTEELVYTTCCLSVYGRGRSSAAVVLLTPAFFATAHFNHAWDLYLSKRFSVTQIAVSVGFQFCYTWIFGIITNAVFIRHGGSLWSCAVCHTFCNFMGFPGVSPESHSTSWTLAYRGLLLAGAVAFTKWL